MFVFSVHCLFIARKLNAHAPCLLLRFLVNVKRHLEAWNMNYSVFGRFQWIRVDANILKTMTRKTEEKRSFSPVCPCVPPDIKWTAIQNCHPDTASSLILRKSASFPCYSDPQSCSRGVITSAQLQREHGQMTAHWLHSKYFFFLLFQKCLWRHILRSKLQPLVWARRLKFMVPCQ